MIFPRAQTLTYTPPHLFLFLQSRCPICTFCFLSGYSSNKSRIHFVIYLSASRSKAIHFTNSSVHYCCHLTLSLDGFNLASGGGLSIFCSFDDLIAFLYDFVDKREHRRSWHTHKNRKLFDVAFQ